MHRIRHGEGRFEEVAGSGVEGAAAASGEAASGGSFGARGGTAVRTVGDHGGESASGLSPWRLGGGEGQTWAPSQGFRVFAGAGARAGSSGSDSGPDAGPVQDGLCLVDAAGGRGVNRRPLRDSKIGRAAGRERLQI